MFWERGPPGPAIDDGIDLGTGPLALEGLEEMTEEGVEGNEDFDTEGATPLGTRAVPLKYSR